MTVPQSRQMRLNRPIRLTFSGLTAFTIIKEVALAIEGGKPADLFALIGGIAVALLAIYL